jgi:hypothetical protein
MGGRGRKKGEERNQKRKEIGFGGVDCINLAQGRDQWQALVNTIMNLWVP